MVWFVHDLKQSVRRANNLSGGNNMAKSIAKSKNLVSVNTKAVELPMKYLCSLEDADLALIFAEDLESKAECRARGRALSSRTNWLDFGIVAIIAIRKNEADRIFCDITNTDGSTSSMKLISENEWFLYYELQAALQAHKEAELEMNVLISANGKWPSKSYFDLVQVIV